jgi:hypothetical protein
VLSFVDTTWSITYVHSISHLCSFIVGDFRSVETVSYEVDELIYGFEITR